MIKSVYIHIPFCQKICSYCDFCKILYNEQTVEKYLNKLELEIINNYKNEQLETIYIGGGTPSSLNIKQLEKLFSITDKFRTKDNLEFTIECNFESITKEKLQLLKKHKVNRLSFGLETTNKNLLKLLNRDIDKEKIKDIIEYANAIGLNNINVDLIYALPNQTKDDLIKDLDFITTLNIKHISTYSLIIEKNTILGIKNTKNIPEDLDYDMYKTISTYLKKKRFNHYEISNFAIDKYESIHNQTYWKNEEYYGFGLGASSYINNIRATNTKSITKYLNNNNIIEKEILSINDQIEYEIILNLRTSRGISKKDFYEKYNNYIDELYNYKNLIDLNIIKEDNNYIYIPENKWYVSNNIIIKFLETRSNYE